MKCFLFLLLLLPCCYGEVVEFRGTDAITIPVVVSSTANGVDSIRSVVLLGVGKAAVKGTWNTDQLQVIQNGNILRISLLQAPPSGHIPVTVIGDNGVLYPFEIRPAAAGANLDPIVNVVSLPDAGHAGALTGGDGRTQADPQQRNGGAFEHLTNYAIKLHKHIRGGRTLPEVHMTSLFNEALLAKEHRRVPGRVRTITDDWRVLEYYQWSLGPVTGTYVGVTYTGREPDADFEYLAQQTDTLRFVWHHRRPDEAQAYDRKWPTIHIHQGVEEFFLLYEEKVPNGQP